MAYGRVIVPLANLQGARTSDGRIGSQLLFGESVDVRDVADGWALVRAQVDGYEGYVRRDAISSDHLDVTHRVCVPSTFIYPSASIKDQPAPALYLNSNVGVTRTQGEFAALASGGFVFASHLCAVGDFATDAVSVAEQFLNVPYLWGGRSFAGIDCSGLVQMARLAAGKASPRDSHQQESAGAERLPLSVLERDTERGLLIFWPGHVAMTIDATRILHASGHVMKVIVEDRLAAMTRMAAKGVQVSSVQRIVA
jgi:cell wall-associated NlpC family hydrolase